MSVYTFGIELEVAGMSPEGAARAIRALGVEAHAEGYNHSTRPHWKVVTDASLRGAGGTCEVVSPVMSTDSLEQMRQVVRGLRAAGARVNVTTGTHVHIGAGDLSPAARALALSNWWHVHDATDLLVAPSRRVSHDHVADAWNRCRGGYHYAERHTVDEVESLADELACGVTRVNVARYRSLNLLPLATYGTFEARLHQGSLNASKLSAWVEYLAAMLTAASAGYAAPRVGGVSLASTETVLEWLAATGGLSERSRGFLSARAAEFAAAL